MIPIKSNEGNDYIPNLEDIYRDRADYIKGMEDYLENMKYEKDNINMEPVGKFKEDLINVLGQAMDDVVKFENSYEALVHIHKRISKMFDEVNKIDAAMMEIKKVSDRDNNCKVLRIDTANIDLEKFNIGEWDETVKPVKGIMSLIARDYGNFHLDIEVGELILLMEDGSFRKVED